MTLMLPALTRQIHASHFRHQGQVAGPALVLRSVIVAAAVLGASLGVEAGLRPKVSGRVPPAATAHLIWAYGPRAVPVRALRDLVDAAAGLKSAEHSRPTPLSGVDEPHAAQFVLALYATFGPDVMLDSWRGPTSPAGLLDRQRANPAYALALADLAKALPRVVRAAQNGAPGRNTREYSDWLNQPGVADLRWRLVGADLSWFGQALLLDSVQLSRPLADSWADARGAKLSALDILDAQITYTALIESAPALNVNTEYGVHTLAMLLVALNMPDAANRLHGRYERYSAEAERLTRQIPDRVATLTGAAHSGARQLIAAHLLQLASCTRALSETAKGLRSFRLHETVLPPRSDVGVEFVSHIFVAGPSQPARRWQAIAPCLCL